MEYIHYYNCNNNICSGTCNNVELYSLNIITWTYNQNQNIIEFSFDSEHFKNAINYAIAHDIKILTFSELIYNNISKLLPMPVVASALDIYNGTVVSSASNTTDDLFSNDNLDLATEYVYPTNYDLDNIIVVGDSTYDSGVAEAYHTSRYGKNTVDLFAPGYTFKTFGYQTGSDHGTSYAAPRVAGAAAVLLNINPDLTPAQVKRYIMAGVDKSTNLTDKCVSGGSLNIYRSAKMLIADMACDWEQVFEGHFTDADNMQVAAYCKAGENTLKAYVWTYNAISGRFSDPEHWFTNYYFGLDETYANNMYRSVAGDFDGDGYDEICTLYDWDDYLFIEGRNYFCHPGNIGLPVENFTGRVVALDYDNDGKDEVAALYQVPNSGAHTRLYTWDFSGTGSGMVATQRLCYDSGPGVYGAECTTFCVVAGNFDDDANEEMAAIYSYRDGLRYTLSIFNISEGHATRGNLIYNRNDVAPSKVIGRVVACNYTGDSRDEIVCMYDNSASVANGIINYGFMFTAEDGWHAEALYTSDQYIYRAELSTNLMLSGDFTEDGYDDIVTFYKLPAALPDDVRGKIYLCEPKCRDDDDIDNGPVGYYTKWDPKW